jgi:hypothetical protein
MISSLAQSATGPAYDGSKENGQISFAKVEFTAKTSKG